MTLDENGEPVYVLAAEQEAADLAALAEERGQQAREANQNSDSYVMTMVLFASVLFFAGVSSKLSSPRNRRIAIGIGIAVLVIGVVILLNLPTLTLRA